MTWNILFIYYKMYYNDMKCIIQYLFYLFLNIKQTNSAVESYHNIKYIKLLCFFFKTLNKCYL